MYQNYETIDSYETKGKTTNKRYRVSRLKGTGHYVVQEYAFSTFTGSKIYNNAELLSCEHFDSDATGLSPEVAEQEAMQYYLSLIDPDEFSMPEGQASLGSTWIKEKSFKLERLSV